LIILLKVNIILKKTVNRLFISLDPSADYLFSTQPFSIFDFSETNRPCLHDDILTPILSPPLQSSGQIATQYKNLTLIQTNNEINLKVKSKKKKIKRLHLPLNRFDRLKKQLKIYLKKKKKTQQQHQPTVSNISISSSSSSTLIDHSNLIDLPLSPDLSKRKYIYKEISLSNNSNQLNLVCFQKKQESIFILFFSLSLENLSMYAANTFNTSIYRSNDSKHV